MHEKQFVAYYRVSTKRQGESGLGLEAQREAVERYVRSYGILLDSFQEIESGGKNSRPALREALELCERRKATLIVAKLDRLARNVAFISSLMDVGADFVAVDNPNANKLTLHILAAMAEYEREMISERTKVGLKRAKLRGVKLGSPASKLLSKKGSAAYSRQVDEFSAALRPILKGIVAAGISSYRGIAKALDARGIKTLHGKKWHQATVSRLMKRLAFPTS